MKSQDIYQKPPKTYKKEIMPYSYSDIVYILNIVPRKDKSGLIKCIVDICNSTTEDEQKNSEYVVAIFRKEHNFQINEKII